MRRAWSIAALAAGAVALAASSARAVDDQSFSQIERGRYLATAADCVACHTSPGGKPYAGGVSLLTPFGTIVTPNITPDRIAGIGAMTDDQFVAALHEGRGRDGKRLFPAMPYPAYTKMSRDDALAIRAYLQTIEPVSTHIESNQLPFPLSLRFNMSVWNALNFKAGRLVDDPAKSPEWNRGRYLVEALGHCGTCHTPKTSLGADKTASALEGANLQDWFAPNITADKRRGIGAWSNADLALYLKTGTSGATIASGPMAEVIEKSTSHLTDPDIMAIVAYLKDQPVPADTSATPIAANDPRMVAGAAIFKDSCAGCHTDSGQGSPGLFPSLAHNAIVQQNDATTLIRIVLQGTQGARTVNAPTTPAMPSFAWRLNDDQVVSLLTYVRNSWGNAAAAPAVKQVSSLRAGH